MKRYIVSALTPGHASPEAIQRMKDMIASYQELISDWKKELEEAKRDEDKQAIKSIIARLENEVAELNKKLEVAQS